MQIVGVAQTDDDAFRVHTIDVWYSQRRRVWLVERLDSEGSQIGATHTCASEEDAAACLQEWLRAHENVHLVAPHEATAAERRVLTRRQDRRAA